MADIQGMAFSSAEYPAQDKEAPFAWDTSDLPPDFFDQFTVGDAMGEAVSEAVGETAEPGKDDADGYAQFGPADTVLSQPPATTSNAPRSMPSSSSLQDRVPALEPGRSRETPAYPPTAVRPESATLHPPHKKKQPPPGTLAAPEPEMLGLDGLSMRSPRVVALPPTPSAPPSSSPPHSRQQGTTTAATTTNKKPGRLESIYSTIRKATALRPRSKQNAAHPPVKLEPSETSGISSNSNINNTHNNSSSNDSSARHNSNLHSISVPDLPSSLSMATSMAGLPHGDPAAMGSSFVDGYLDDPFSSHEYSGLPTTDSGFMFNPAAATATTTPGTNPHDRQINWLFSNPFGHDAMSNAGGAGAQWETSFASSDGSAAPGQEAWWDPMVASSQASLAHNNQGGYQSAGAKNATMSLVMQMDSSNMGGYPYGLPDNVDPGDLVAGAGRGGSIHMPQPRHPHAAALLNNELAVSRQPPFPMQGGNFVPGQQQHHLQLQPSQRQEQLAPHDQPPSASACTPSFRRPKPRAPSSGARYHQSGALTSPRKPRGRSTSSASPTPTQTATSGGGGSSRNRATSRSRQHSQQRQQLRRSTSMHDMVADPPPALQLQPPPPLPPPPPQPVTTNQHQPPVVAVMENNHSMGGLPTAATDPSSSFRPVNAVRKRRSWSHARRTASTSGPRAEPRTPDCTGRVPSTAASGMAGWGRRRASEGGILSGCGRSPEKARGRGSGSGSVSSSAAQGSVSSSSSGGGASNSFSAAAAAAAAAGVPPPPSSGIGFVNFTPDDGTFLMTGVAPSGSSKTKARREREAAERQRRINEAVMQAVAAAGGDLARLREEGIELGG